MASLFMALLSLALPLLASAVDLNPMSVTTHGLKKWQKIVIGVSIGGGAALSILFWICFCCGMCCCLGCGARRQRREDEEEVVVTATAESVNDDTEQAKAVEASNHTEKPNESLPHVEKEPISEKAS